jgi:hypothetical protein
MLATGRQVLSDTISWTCGSDRLRSKYLSFRASLGGWNHSNVNALRERASGSPFRHRIERSITPKKTRRRLSRKKIKQNVSEWEKLTNQKEVGRKARVKFKNQITQWNGHKKTINYQILDQLKSMYRHNLIRNERVIADCLTLARWRGRGEDPVRWDTIRGCVSAKPLAVIG